jgi:hypothetical protein
MTNSGTSRRFSSQDMDALQQRYEQQDRTVTPKLGPSAKDVEKLRQQLLNWFRSR